MYTHTNIHTNKPYEGTRHVFLSVCAHVHGHVMLITTHVHGHVMHIATMISWRYDVIYDGSVTVTVTVTVTRKLILHTRICAPINDRNTTPTGTGDGARIQSR
jgi:hypothetical protein